MKEKKSKRKFFLTTILAILGVLFIVFLILPEDEEESGDYAQETVEARYDTDTDFTMQLDSGETFTLSEQAGKVVLINFWATWCGPCVEEMPALQKLYEEYDEEDVRIILVNAGENSETVHRFLSQNGYTLPCIYDTANTVNDQYGVSAIPYTIIFGKDGSVTASFEGSYGSDAQYELYKEAIEEALE